MTYTADDVLKVLDQIVLDFGPDYQVRNCFYADRDTGQPVCIVGQVLYRLALPFPEYDDIWSSVQDSHDGYDFDDDANMILGHAQTVQDNRSSLVRERTWGTAVAFARNVYENEGVYCG